MEKLGFSYDWKKYTLREVMYSHFQLFGAQSVVFCNILDPGDVDMRKPNQVKPYDVSEHRVTLPMETIQAGLKITGDGLRPYADGEGESAAQLVEDENYTPFYDDQKNKCIIELLEDSSSYGATSLKKSAPGRPGALFLRDVQALF